MAEEEERSLDEPHEPSDEDDDDAAGTGDHGHPYTEKISNKNPIPCGRETLLSGSSWKRCQGKRLGHRGESQARYGDDSERATDAAKVSGRDPGKTSRTPPPTRPTRHVWGGEVDPRWQREGRRHPLRLKLPVRCCSKGSTQWSGIPIPTLPGCPSMLTRKAVCHIRL